MINNIVLFVSTGAGHRPTPDKVPLTKMFYPST